MSCWHVCVYWDAGSLVLDKPKCSLTKCNNCIHRLRESIMGSQRLRSWYRAGRTSLWTRQTGAIVSSKESVVCVFLNEGLKEVMLFLPVLHISVSVGVRVCVCVCQRWQNCSFRSCRNRWDSINANPNQKKKHVNAHTFVMHVELLPRSNLK